MQSESLLRAVGDPWALVAPVHYLAEILLARGDYTGALAREEEALALTRATGDRWRLAGCLDSLGEIALLQGVANEAHAAFTESLALSHTARNQGRIAYELCSLGHAALLQGDRAEARVHYWESLTLYHQRDDRRGIAHTLEAIARLAMADKKADRAVRLFAAATLGQEVLGCLPLFQRRDHDKHIAAAQFALGEVVFAAAWNTGRAMTLDEAVDYALGVPA